MNYASKQTLNQVSNYSMVPYGVYNNAHAEDCNFDYSCNLQLSVIFFNVSFF